MARAAGNFARKNASTRERGPPATGSGTNSPVSRIRTAIDLIRSLSRDHIRTTLPKPVDGRQAMDSQVAIFGGRRRKFVDFTGCRSATTYSPAPDTVLGVAALVRCKTKGVTSNGIFSRADNSATAFVLSNAN